MSEMLIGWWLLDRSAPSVAEVAIRLGMALALTALCWRLMHRPVKSLHELSVFTA